jgi:putative inorganic carbon (hco3(-)) transporter
MSSPARFGRPPRVDDLPFLAAITVAAAFGGLLLALTAYEVSPLALPAALIAVAFVVVTLVRPAWGLAGAMAAVAAEPSGITVAGLSPAEGGLALVGAFWVGRALIRPEAVAMPRLRDTPVIVLLAVVGIGLVYARDPYPIARVLLLWTLFYFVYLQVQTFAPNEMKLVVIAFALGAAVLGGLGAFDYLRSGDQTLFAGGELTGARAASAFADPNYYAALLVLALLPALGLVLADPRRYAYLGVACVITFAGIALSLSRGALLAAFGGGLLLLAWQRARWIALGFAALFTGVTLAGANPIVESKQFNVVEERLSTLTGPGVEERNLRPEIWALARDVASEHPFFGIGVNQFQFETGRANLTEDGSPLENAHSIVFSLAAETGLIGLAAFLIFLGQLAARAARALSTSDTLRYGLGLGIAAALLGFVLQGLTVVQIRVSFIAGTFFALAGMLTALADRASAEKARPRAPLR